MPAEIPEASAVCCVVLRALTSAVPRRASVLPLPTRLVTRASWLAVAWVALTPSRPPDAPDAWAAILLLVCRASTLRLRAANWVWLPRLALIRPMPSATALDRPTATPARFKPLASALAAVLAVPRTVTSFTVFTTPPWMTASTVGLALAVATAPLAARPMPPANAVAWASVSMLELASTLRARTTSPL